MTQQTSPFIGANYGWAFGESGWNPGMDDNLLKFSYMFDRNIDGVVSILPAPVQGKAYFNSTDNRVYYAVGTPSATWYSSPIPLNFELFNRQDGMYYRFNGTSLVIFQSNDQLDTRLNSVESAVSSLGTAAFKPVAYFASATDLTNAVSTLNTTINTRVSPLESFKTDLTNNTDYSKGTYLVGYIANLNQSVSRTLYSRLQDTVNIKDFGETVNSTTIQNAINTLYALGGTYTILLPAGTFSIANPITLKPGISIKGAGQYTTTLQPTTAGMTVFSVINATNSGTNLSVSDLNINCNTVANVQAFKFVYCNRVDLENIIFYGCLVNFEFDRGGLHRIRNCTSAGTATLKSGSIKLWSSTDTEYGFVFSVIDNYRIENNGMGVQSPAVYFRRAVGIKVNNLVTNDGDYTGTCVLIENDSQGIEFNGGLIVGYSLGAVFQQGTGIVKTPIYNSFDGVDFDQNMTNAILFNGGRGNQITGGAITSSNVGTSSTAINFTGSTATANTLFGVRISGYNGATGTGVLFQNSSYNRMIGCKVDGSTRGIVIAGTNTYLQVQDNNFQELVTTPISGSINGVGNSFANNSGYSASTQISSPSVPATGVTVTNNYGCVARVHFSGGTVSTVSINGQGAVYVNGMSVLLSPGETLAWNGTVAPTWNWIGV